MIAERWGGSATVRYAIAREIEDLTEALTTDLRKLPTFEHIQDNQDLKVLSTILINMSFTWYDVAQSTATIRRRGTTPAATGFYRKCLYTSSFDFPWYCQLGIRPMPNTI